MKKLVILGKTFANAEYSSVLNWLTETPFISPFQQGKTSRIIYSAYAEWTGDNSSRNVKISAQNTALPASWQSAVGNTFSITLPTSWLSEGFELGPVMIFVSQSASDHVFLEGTIISISGNNAEIIINNIIASVGTTPIETEEDSICFLQDLTPRHQPAAMVVRDGEEGAFFSALNPNASAFGANPDRAWDLIWGVSGNLTVNLPYWAQQWGVSSWPAITGAGFEFSPYHVWAIQDDYDLNSQQNQNAAFTNTLRLLFGIRPDFYTHFKLRTAHVNCLEDGSPTGGAVLLSGSNGNWSVNITPPPGGTLVASWIALTNAEAAHQGASLHAGELVQQSPHYTSLSYTDTTTFTVVPPNPQAVAVAVFDFGTQYGVRVSNRISILPPPSPLVQLKLMQEDTVSGERWAFRGPYPWDAVGARVECDPSVLQPGAQHPFIRGRWWAFVRHVSGQTWMLEDAEFEYPPFSSTSPISADVTKLFHFCYGPAITGPMLQANTEHDARLYLAPNDPLNEHYLRTYAAVYLNGNIGTLSLAPATGAPVPGFQYIVGAMIETASGINYAEVSSFDYINPFTNAGSFANYTWQSPPTPPVPPGETLYVEWRLAVFKNDFSKTPVWQDDFQHAFLNPPIAPITGPHPGGLVFTFSFAQPQEPGDYVLFARLLYNLVNNSRFPYNQDNYAEYTTRKVALLPEPESTANACPPCVPALESEVFSLLYFFNPGISGITQVGDAFLYTGPPQCQMPAPNCSYTIVPSLPQGWVDVMLHFDNYIRDMYVADCIVTLRLPGTFRRIDDQVTHEKYVTLSQREDTVIRSFKRAYELELFINNECLLYQAELIKYCKSVVSVKVNGLSFVNFKTQLVPEDFRIRDVGGGAVVTIQLVERPWRSEVRLP